jgi:hypothetical protein
MISADLPDDFWDDGEQVLPDAKQATRRQAQYQASNDSVVTRFARLRNVAGNHASSRPAPSGDCAARARTPRKPAARAATPIDWQRSPATVRPRLSRG